MVALVCNATVIGKLENYLLDAVKMHSHTQLSTLIPLLLLPQSHCYTIDWIKCWWMRLTKTGRKLCEKNVEKNVDIDKIILNIWRWLKCGNDNGEFRENCRDWLYIWWQIEGNMAEYMHRVLCVFWYPSSLGKCVVYTFVIFLSLRIELLIQISADNSHWR